MSYAIDSGDARALGPAEALIFKAGDKSCGAEFFVIKTGIVSRWVQHRSQPPTLQTWLGEGRKSSRESTWGSAFFIALPVIVAAASWTGWREDGDVIGFRGFTGAVTPQRGALVAAVIIAVVAFLALIDTEPFAMTRNEGTGRASSPTR